MAILKQAEAWTLPISELCREHGMSRALLFISGERKSAGMDASLMARMKEWKDENRGDLKRCMPKSG